MQRLSSLQYSVVCILSLLALLSFFHVYRILNHMSPPSTAVDNRVIFHVRESSCECVPPSPSTSTLSNPSHSLESLLITAQEAVVSSSVVERSSDPTQLETLIAALQQLSFQEQSHVVNQVNGREFPYPMSCPRSIPPGNYSVVIAYHVGIVGNWRNIVLDQMTTLEVCGLGKVLSKMLVTYSSSQENEMELKQIMGRYSFASKVELYNSADNFPYEGLAMNLLYDYCSGIQEETVAFYMHNKGCSHYDSRWREVENIQEWGSYAKALFWRKYLEYFLIERPGLCIDAIVHGGADVCGAHYTRYNDGFQFYGGNFWAASCNRHIQSLSKIKLEPVETVRAQGRYEELYGFAEGWINRPRVPRDLKFVALHNNTIGGLYRWLMPVDVYSDYSHRWMPPQNWEPMDEEG